MAKVFFKKPPVRLELVEYRLIEQIINEIPEMELTEDERQLREKVRRICTNIEKAIAYKAKMENQHAGSQD